MTTVEPPSTTPIACRDITACLLCGASHLQDGGFAYVYRDTEFPAVRCAACGFVFLARQPRPEEFSRLYAQEYFDSDYHCGHEEHSYFNADQQVEAAKTLLGFIEAVQTPGKILEVGCAGGYFLKAARDRGWDAVGIELSDSAATFAREELGLDVRTGTLDSIQLPRESIDAAYMGDVLEHVPSPLATLRAVGEALRPGGVLLVAGPVTINSLDRRVGLAVYRSLKRRKVLRQPPYHVSEFTPRTLRYALRRAGFEARWLREQKIPPTFGNRHRRAPMDHVAKLVLDAVNWPITRFAGRLGDRAIVVATTPAR